MSGVSASVAEDLLLDLLDRLDVSEAVDLEYKECRQKLPTSLWPTLSAFANTNGGVVVLGVAEVEDALAISGVKNAAQIQQQLVDQLRNREKISLDVCGPDGVQRHRVAGVDILVARVASVPTKDRPVYISGNAYGGTYVRRNSGDYQATKSEIDRMMRAASPVASDASIVVGTGLNDLDTTTFDRYRQRHRVAQPGAPRNGYDDLRFLQSINGYGTEEVSGRDGLTVAGLLMFGTDEAIIRWRSRHLIDYRQEEMGSVARWDDRVVWEGNLLTAFERIYPRLIEDLPLAFELEGPYRVQEGRLQGALREALINLLVHADYTEHDVSLIKRTPSRFLFRNPGASLVGALDLDAGDRSDPRNPSLVRMFRFIGLADEAGSGLPKIVRAWREAELRPPVIDPGGERYEFSLQLEYIHVLSDADRTWLSGIGIGPQTEERLALIHARYRGAVDNLSLRTLTGLHASDATQVLARLRDGGYLTMEGNRRSARYRLGPAAMVIDVTGSEGNHIPGPGNEPSVQGMDPPSSASSDPSLQGNDSSLEGTDTPSLQANDSSLEGTDTPSLQGTILGSGDDRLLAIVAPIRAMKRVPAFQMEQIIRDLCIVRPLTRNEIGRLMNRSGPHTRELVRRMVDRGTLVMTSPDKPNDPNQRYRGVPDSGEPQGTVGG